MILKGGAVGGGGLAAHLRSKENESVEVVLSTGLLSRDIAGAVAELRARGAGITAKPIFHTAISAAPGQKWGETEQRQAVAVYVREFRLEGVPLLVVRHQKDAQGVGRDEHLHIVASRIDHRGRVISDAYTRIRNEKVARGLEHDLGHRLTIGKHNRSVMTALRTEGREDIAKWMAAEGAHAAPRPTADLSHAEAQQQNRTNITKVQAGAEVLAAFRAADCGTAFRAALAERGYHLARGRESGIMVVDPAGGSHDLTRLLRAALKAEGDKLPAKEIRAQIDAKTADLDPASLPPLAEVVASVREGATLAPAGAAVAPEIDAKPAEVPTAAAILAKMTQEKVTFNESDIDKALRGIADKSARAALKSEILDRADVLTVALDADGERRMTTLDMLKVEAGILDRAEALSAGRRFTVATAEVDAGIAAYAADFKQTTGFDLAAEQTGGIRHITAGADFARVTGVAGAGKTTLLTGAARIWDAVGYRVEGMALSGVAAARLGESGIKSDTIAARLMAWDRLASLTELQQSKTFTDESRTAVLRSLDGWKEAAIQRGENPARMEAMREQVAGADRLEQLDLRTRRWLSGWLKRQAAKDIDSRTILVIDEAGMVNHRLFSRILAHAERVGAKVAAVGDPEQIQPIEAGAAFRLLEKIAPAWRLDEVVRQNEGFQRQATKDLAAGDPARAEAAVRAYAAHGDVMTGIRGTGDREVIYAEAAAKLGRDLDATDRAQIDRVAAYVGARVEAGSLWREIEAATGEPEQHPLYEQFRNAQERRGAAVQALTADLDAARPWLARYQVDGEGFAADLGYAEGMPRALAQALAADRAEALGLAGLEPDVKLAFDWRGAARQALFEDWKADLARDGMAISRIILAYTRADVARLNADARVAMREGGHLTGPDVSIATAIDGEAGMLALAVGDRVMTLANDRKVGVQNGTTGRVVAIEPQDDGTTVLTVATDDGRTVNIDTSAYKAIQHGYAATLHKSQGVTVDRAWMLNHGLIDRHLAYVGLSRHRDSVKVYAAALDAATVDALARQFGKGRTKDAISDYVDARRLLREPAAVRADIRQAIGATASLTRDLGQRLAAAAGKAIALAHRAIHSPQQKMETHYARPRPIADTFGAPLRQLDFDATAEGSAPRRADRLPEVPRLAVARDRDRASVLLPRHTSDRMVIGRARSIDAMRRAGLRSGPVTAHPRPPAASSAITITGEHPMAASISGSSTRTADARDEAFAESFAQILKEYRELSAKATRTPEQDDEREALADAMRSMARDEENLRRKTGTDAEEIAALAQKRDWDHAKNIDARAVGDMPKRSRADDLETWRKLGDQHPDRIADVVQHGQRIDIHLTTGQILHDRGNRITSDGPITKEGAEIMALAAIEKGWTEVTLKGSRAEKEAMAEAMVARGLAVTNPELQDYIKALDRAHDLAADRRALAAARQQPDLADEQAFARAISDYQRAIVTGASPDQLRTQRANLIARGEAVAAATDGRNASAAQWATEGLAVDTARASKAHVAHA